MLARQLVALCDSGEPNILQKLYGITARSADALEVQARRLVKSRQGDQELAPERPVSRSQRATAPVAGQDQDQASDLEEQAQARARRIRAESYSLQLDSIGKLRGRLRVLERNIAAGYHEWSDDLQLTKRTLELVEGVTA
jgi:hypothetical protein